ncbi:hypothetical protein EXS54_00945 [Patescibacteria group bacterium]|nr:hypothetical protein [Patescibacteria group bacterium]
MTRNKKIAAVVLVLLVVGVGVGIFVANDGQTNDVATPKPTTKATTKSQATPASQSNRKETVTVRYGDNGFSPATVTVKAGSSITFINESNQSINPSSDPHPTHTTNPQLTVGTIDAGESKTITVTKVGQWGVHNHLNPSEKLTVIVQ